MELRLYNTLTRRKEVFRPQHPDRITLYVCGPTVYNRPHVGNARPEVVFDVLARLLRHLYPGHELIHARNVTDIDDKIMAAAEREGVGVDAIAQRYEAAYDADMAALGVEPPTLRPRATEHVPQMVALIGTLIEREVAYAADGHVLFHVPADPDYGSLSGRDRGGMVAGARVEVAPYKRDPADFVLWKPSAEDQPGWESPWGRGRPGWHIECSAMIREHLGDTIDIHGGGQDLIFPHHENEAAQSRCAHHAPLAKIWMHNGMLAMSEAKMSKSVGNVVTVRELLEQGWDGEVIRLALLSAHYRQPLEWSDALLDQSRRTLDRWYGLVRGETLIDTQPPGNVLEALSDDLNVPQALAALAETVSKRDLSGLAAGARLLGMFQHSAEAWLKRETIAKVSGAAGVVEMVGSEGEVSFTRSSATDINGMGEASVIASISEREAARAARDFATADRIRDELAEQGVLLEDTPTGTIWRRA